ncbi:MAG TPA: YggT family protein [bacterium]|nr:YggT family protein [bacterium]
MSILGYLVFALAKVIGLIIDLYTIVVIISALISWVSPDPYNPLVRLLRGLTEPAFNLARRMLPNALLRLRIDISPIIVLLALVLLDALVSGILVEFGRRLIHS